MANLVYQGRCPSLLDLWMDYRLDTRKLASQADVPYETILAMTSYFPVDLEDTKKVISAFSCAYNPPQSGQTGVDLPISMHYGRSSIDTY